MKISLLSKIWVMTKLFLYLVWLQTIFVSVALASSSYAQKLEEIEISCHWENVALEEAFNDVQQQTEFFFTYDGREIDKIRVSANENNVPLLDLLKYLSNQTDLRFSIDRGLILVDYPGQIVPQRSSVIDRHILIPDVVELSTLTFGARYQVEIKMEVPRRTITGVILGSDGEPLIGATVIDKVSGSGTTTDFDGRFSLETEDGAVTLVVSYIGYETREVAVSAGEREISIELFQTVAGLDEVVVIGYGSQLKGDVTGAIENIELEDLEISGFTSTDQILQGRVAGVQISNVSGNPGSGQQINIRGISSIQGSVEPLIVIDGVPVLNNDLSVLNGPLGTVNTQSPLSLINPNDIASIDVLKDAASASIYGSRASNGVILITTKSGQEGKTTVSLNAYTGIQDQPIEIETADVDTWYDIMNEAIDNANAQQGLSAGDPGFIAQRVKPADAQTTDWISAITEDNSNVSNIDLSVSGGNEKTSFFTSLGYFSQEGWYRTQKFQRFSTKLRVDHYINPKIKIGLNFLGSHGINNKVSTHEGGTRLLQRSLEQRPGDPIFHEDGSYNIGGSATLTRHNAVQVINENESEYKTYRGIISAYAQYNFLERFTYKFTANTDQGSYFDYLYRSPSSIRARGVGGEVHESRAYSTNYSLDNQLTYSGTSASGDLNYDVTAVYSFQKFVADRNYIKGIGLPSESFKRISSATSYVTTNFGIDAREANSKSESALESLTARAQFKYLNRYLMSLSIRRDGSSRLSEDNRYGTFPAISLGWKLSDEPFFNSNLISNFKVRTSYGLTGNLESVADFASLALVSGGANYNNQDGIEVIQMGNEDLKWETASQFDFGFDVDLLEGRIGLTMDYFYQETDDLLFDKPIRSTFGFTTLTENIGTMVNNGIELSINATAITKPNFSWNVGFNVSFIKNEIKALNDGLDQIIVGDNVLRVGESIGSFFLLRQEGIYQSDSDVPESLFNQGVRAGDVRYQDVNNDGIINADDRQIVGNPLPDYYGGLSNTFTYRDFDLYIFTPFSVGNETYWERGDLDALGGRERGMRLEAVEDRWTGSGTSNEVPRAIALAGPTNHNVQASDRWIEEASYFSIRTITLGYNLPKHLTNKYNLGRLRLYVTANNLHTFTDYPGYTPEASNSRDPRSFGRDYVTAPPLRTYIFGLNLNL